MCNVMKDFIYLLLAFHELNDFGIEETIQKVFRLFFSVLINLLKVLRDLVLKVWIT